MFLVAINELLSNRDEAIANCRVAQDLLSNCSEIDVKIAELHLEAKEIARLSRKAISDNARVAQDQDEFNTQISGYQERHRQLMEQVTDLEIKKHERQNRQLELNRFIRELASQSMIIDEFDERLWMVSVERVTVGVDGELVFGFGDVNLHTRFHWS